MWYKVFYSDFLYSHLYKIIKCLKTLINIYFVFGIKFNNNTLLSNFWYKKSFLRNKTSLYFRKHYYTHKTLAIEHAYSLRIKSQEFFPLKLYIISYDNWIITTIKWYKPLKKTSITNSVAKGYSKNIKTYNLSIFNKKLNPVINNRLKTIFFIFKNNINLYFLTKKYTF
jgi:hypothetical protein